jgi:hypothetical protein
MCRGAGAQEKEMKAKVTLSLVLLARMKEHFNAEGVRRTGFATADVRRGKLGEQTTRRREGRAWFN